MRLFPFRLLLICLALLSGPGLCAAQETVGDVILTVDVAPAKDGAGDVQFDRDDLEKLRQVTYRTTTIWTDGVLEFKGVPLSEILKVAGVTGSALVLHASNDYAAEIPIAGVTDDVPMVAMLIDGKPMSLRDKGPLWLVYPFDRSTIYQSEVIYTRAVWQLVRIEVLP